MYLNYLARKKRKESAAISGNVTAQGVVMRWKRPAFPTPTLPKPIPAPSASPDYVHLLNDLTTPELSKSQTLIPAQIPQCPFAVQSFKGSGHLRGSVEFQAANAYITIAETLNLANTYGGDRKLPKWPRARVLGIFPRAGEDLNAYYDGRSLRFFYFSNSRIGGSVYSVDSADIVAHECGHGILDCYRPDLWNAAYIEIGCFHEAFGDFVAIMHSLSHDEILDKVLSETNGNLRISNVASRIAEHFGRSIYKLNPNGRNPDYLRSMINEFNYVDPGQLPEEAPDSSLAAEVHSFSRVFTGAIWDILVVIYEDMVGKGMEQLEALRKSRDCLCRYMMLAIQNAPANAKFFASVAKTILWADATSNNGMYQDKIREVFVNRNIITNEVRILSGHKCPNDSGIVKKSVSVKTKLRDHFVCAQKVSGNELYDVELTTPQDEAILYDANGNLMDHIVVQPEENLAAAMNLVSYLQNSKNYGQDATTPWEIQNGKLIRTRTCCI